MPTASPDAPHATCQTFTKAREQMPIQIDNRGISNTVVGDPNSFSGRLTFHGENCRVNLPSHATTGNLDVNIYHRDAVIDLSGLRRFGKVRVTSKNGGNLHIGESSTIEECYFLADGKEIILGRDCMISFGISFRTTDAHGIFDISTGERLNFPNHIKVGDHVWISQGCIIAKGSDIGTGTIIGASSYVSNKILGRNSIYAGTPARKIRSGVIWDRKNSRNIYEETADIDPYLLDNIDQWAPRS